MSIDNSYFQLATFNNIPSFSYIPSLNLSNLLSYYTPTQNFAFSFIPQFNFNFLNTVNTTPTSSISTEDFKKKCSEIVYNQTSYTTGTYNYSGTTNYTGVNYPITNTIQTSSTTSNTTSQREVAKSSIATTVDYKNLSKSKATEKASQDSHLENLTSGGRRWHISEKSFVNDIPFAAKGTGKVLDKVASIVGQDLVITSALGTKTSPHNKDIKKSHYDSTNPKLDIRGDKALADKLKATGYFSHVYFEGDHIDVQIKESAYQQFEAIA